MGHVDGLSRLPSPVQNNIESFEIKYFNTSGEMPLKNNLIKQKTKTDSILSQVYDHVLKGWNKNSEENLNVFFDKRNFLHCEDECLFYRDRLVIPSDLRLKVRN